jgi:FHA domain-containing protein
MSARLMLHRSGSPPEEVALAGPATLGGGPDDAVRLEGAHPRALALSPSPAGLLVQALVTGVALCPATGPARPLAPGRLRLLRPGESLRMGTAILEVSADATPGTRVLAGRMLGEAGRGDDPVAGPHLLALEGPDAGRRLALGEEATVGRGRAATLRLSDASASRRHARVARASGGFTLEDLRSKNGLRLGGAPVGPDPAPLRPGDEIALGESVLALVLPADAAPPSRVEADAPVPGALPAGRPAPRRSVLIAAVALLAGAAAMAAVALGA